MPGGGKLYHNLGFQEMVLKPIFCEIFFGKPSGFCNPIRWVFFVVLAVFGVKNREECLETLEAVCFVPVHDNYLLNKQTVAAKQQLG